MSFTPRDYQIRIAKEATDKLRELGIVYLSLEVRTGKTFTSLMAAHAFGAKKVLFLTVKKAIEGIQKDIDTFGMLDVEILSIDSAHKATGAYDLVIVDEAHSIGSFPVPTKRAKAIKAIAHHLPIILLSGTPNPESLSQLYHQFWISDRSPFKEHKSFYKFSHEYIDIKVRYFSGRPTNDYSKGKREMFEPVIQKYFITFSQKQANFNCEVMEHLCKVEMSVATKGIIDVLKEDKVFYFSDVFIDSEDVILADTAVKMASKIHQLSSGSVIVEGGDYIITDTRKVDYIKREFPDKKLAIFYKYRGEKEMLLNAFGDKVTESIAEFDSTDKHIICQIRSGSTGINLSKADCQIYMNIDFSAKDWIQSKARMQTQARESVDVYVLISHCGIERDIYNTVSKKMDFTSRYFKPLFKTQLL